jgi:hypothetical protein
MVIVYVNNDKWLFYCLQKVRSVKSIVYLNFKVKASHDREITKLLQETKFGHSLVLPNMFVYPYQLTVLRNSLFMLYLEITINHRSIVCS